MSLQVFGALGACTARRSLPELGSQAKITRKVQLWFSARVWLLKQPCRLCERQILQLDAASAAG